MIQELKVIFYDESFKLFKFEGHKELDKLKGIYKNGVVIDDKTIKSTMINEEINNNLSQTELKEFNQIKELFLFTPMTIERTNTYTANATLRGGDFEPITLQLGINHLLEVANARKNVYFKHEYKKIEVKK